MMQGRLVASIFSTAMSAFAIGSDDLGLELALVGQRDLNLGGAVHDVVIGEDVAVRGHDDAGAEAVLALFGHLARRVELRARIAEKLPEERIVRNLPAAKELGGDLGYFRGRNTHHRGQDLFDYRREPGRAGSFVRIGQLQFESRMCNSQDGRRQSRRRRYPTRAPPPATRPGGASKSSICSYGLQ